jgi:hypothetical protein
MCVAVLMMPTMRGHPSNQGAFERHGAESGQDELDDAIGFKSSMSKQSMIADSYAKSRRRIHAHKKYEFDPTERAAPQGGDSDN